MIKWLIIFSLICIGKIYTTYFNSEFPLGIVSVAVAVGIYWLSKNVTLSKGGTERESPSDAPAGPLRRSLYSFEAIGMVLLLLLLSYTSFWLAFSALSPYKDAAELNVSGGNITHIYHPNYRMYRIGIATPTGELKFETRCGVSKLKAHTPVEVTYSNSYRGLLTGTRQIISLRAGDQNICSSGWLDKQSWKKRQMLSGLLLLIPILLIYSLGRSLRWILSPAKTSAP